LSPVNNSIDESGLNQTSDSILPKLTSPREGENVFKKSRYEKKGSTELGETSIESAVEKSKRYLKTYR
jgi:hypothetical protein